MTELREWTYDDCRLFVRANDLTFEHYPNWAAYEPYVLPVFLAALKPTSTVLDVGANIGIFTVLAAKRCKRVIAVEASTDNAKLLAANVAANSLRNVDIFPVAATERVKMVTFERTVRSNKVLRPRQLAADKLEMSDITMGIPLDTLLPTVHIDVLKLDIEGSEYPALIGAPRILDQRPITFLEYTPAGAMDISKVDASKILEMFFDRGYTATILYRGRPPQNVDRDIQNINKIWKSEIEERKISHLDLRMDPPS